MNPSGNITANPPIPRVQQGAALALLAVFLGATALATISPFRSAPAEAATIGAEKLAITNYVVDPGATPSGLTTISGEAALALNQARPALVSAIPVAAPFMLSHGNASNWTSAVDCLTAAIYYEAATEPSDGQSAVAQVVLNRMRLSSYPSTVCNVVFQGSERRTGCQFSFTCDGSLFRKPSAYGWKRARDVAVAALSGQVNAHVGLATHYHADYVMPYWAPSLVKLKTIGRHIFYGGPSLWNRNSAFTQRYAGGETGIRMPSSAPVVDVAGLDIDAGTVPQFARVIPIAERPVLTGSSVATDRPVAGMAPSAPSAANRWVLGVSAAAPSGNSSAQAAPASVAAIEQ